MTTILHGHHRDYETWAAMRHLPVTEELIVFLDEGLDCHPDYAILGIPPPVEARLYRDEMVEVLLNIAKYFHVHDADVVIAAHPKVERGPTWAEHFVVRQQTCDLVRRAKVVLAHTSTAIHFAILWNKPVVFINLPMMRWHEPTQAAMRWWQAQHLDTRDGRLAYKKRYLKGTYIQLLELRGLAPTPYIRWTGRQWFRAHPRYTLDHRTESCLTDMPTSWRLRWWRLRHCRWRTTWEGLMNRLPYWVIRVPKPMAILVGGMRDA